MTRRAAGVESVPPQLESQPGRPPKLLLLAFHVFMFESMRILAVISQDSVSAYLEPGVAAVVDKIAEAATVFSEKPGSDARCVMHVGVAAVSADAARHDRESGVFTPTSAASAPYSNSNSSIASQAACRRQHSLLS